MNANPITRICLEIQIAGCGRDYEFSRTLVAISD